MTAGRNSPLRIYLHSANDKLIRFYVCVGVLKVLFKCKSAEFP